MLHSRTSLLIHSKGNSLHFASINPIFPVHPMPSPSSLAITNKIEIYFLIVLKTRNPRSRCCFLLGLQVAIFSLCLFFFFFFGLFRATLVAYGCSQARGQIGAMATDLCHIHSNSGSKLCLRPTPQFMAMPDP